MKITIKHLPRLVRTLWYVPPRQLAARVWARLKRLYYMTPLYPLLLEKLSDSAPATVQPLELWKGNKARGDAIVKDQTFTFVGRSIVKPDGQWLPTEASPLWLFNLHYWDWLADLYAAKDRQKAQQLVEDWLLSCDSYHPTIWHPYPTSLRIVNMLIYGQWLLKDASGNLVDAYWESLHRQLAYLSDNLEHDLGGNHLLKNIKALIFGGVCLPGGQSLVLEGQRLLIQELHTQILPDGGHYERTPMYHVQVLMDLLEIHALLRKANLKSLPLLDDVLDRMAEALAFYRYPDGRLGLWNDSAEGDKSALDALSRRCGGSVQPPNEVAGYVRLKQKNLMVMLDAGRVGPDEIPGHAHAQTLAVEVCWGKDRVFTNSGTYAYQHPLRHTLRGTNAHNTVMIDEENSAEVWAEHRVGRRPRLVTKDVVNEKSGRQSVTASHDGYRHLGVHHERTVALAADGATLTGTDRLLGKKGRSHRVRAYFHVHPTIKCHLKDEQQALLTLPNGQKLRFKITGGRLYTLPAHYAAQFGELQETTQLVIQGFWRKGCQIEWLLETTEE